MFLKTIFFSLFCLLTLSLSAQELVEFKAQVRARSEYDNKDFNSDNEASTYTDLRTRVAMLITPSEDIKAFIQLQDSRRFGTEPNTLTSTANLDLHQAYFEVINLFGTDLGLKAGRMEVIYGPQRLVGAVGWHNVGRSFDGAVINYTNKDFNAEFFSFKTVESNQLGDTLDQNFMGAYGNIALSKNYSLQPFLMWERNTPSESLSRMTLGFYVKGNSGGLFHETEFAYQMGDITVNGSEQDVKALMAALNLGYEFESPIKPKVSVGVDYISGDDDAADGEYRVFHTLFATNHKYYGFMDYFINLPVHTMNLGLTDLHAKINIAPDKKISLAAAFHLFKSSEEYTLVNGNASSDFGTEIDLTLGYVYNKNLKFELGASLFSPGEIFEETRGKESSTWAYIMAIFNM